MHPLIQRRFRAWSQSNKAKAPCIKITFFLHCRWADKRYFLGFINLFVTTSTGSIFLSIQNNVGIVVASVAILVSGCASTTPTTTNTNAGTGVGAQPTPLVAEVPALQVTIDCGTCAVKPTIPSLIVEGYNEAASKAGRKVSKVNYANLTIKEYVARGDAARFLAGAFAGKDEIKAVIAYQGKNYAVEDYYRNAWLGIDTLAKKIGEMSYAELK